MYIFERNLEPTEEELFEFVLQPCFETTITSSWLTVSFGELNDNLPPFADETGSKSGDLISPSITLEVEPGNVLHFISYFIFFGYFSSPLSYRTVKNITK